MNSFDNKYETLLKQFNNDVAASYFVGRYYFVVNTGKNRHELGLATNQNIIDDTQRRMQSENLISLFHEYIHYVHEISTVIGNFGLGLDVALKSIFSNYFNTDLNSSSHKGLDKTDLTKFDMFCKIYATKEVINGNVIQNEKLLKVKGFVYKAQSIYAPHGSSLKEIKIDVPMITVEKHENGKYADIKVAFGKFILYEGLAYELDRIMDKQLKKLPDIKDDLKGSEYTLLRYLAKHIMPAIDTHSFLVIASFSLSYIDSGKMFIEMTKQLKEDTAKGISISNVLDKFRKSVSDMLFSKVTDFNAAQDELIKVFEKRKQLHLAFKVITQQAKNAYLAKCEKPSFEVDLIVKGDYKILIDVVPPCDYMYIFKDNEEFNRDFFGTASFDDDSSQALKVLIGYDHYQKSHELHDTASVEAVKTIKCPFFACCNLQLRLDNAVICASKPWRIFEISSNSNRQYCWYGQAVGEFKGHNEK